MDMVADQASVSPAVPTGTVPATTGGIQDGKIVAGSFTGVDEIMRALESNKTLIRNLQWNETLSDTAMERLWYFLRDNATTVHLENMTLARNSLTVLSSESVTKSICAQSCTLVTLDLSECTALFSKGNAQTLRLLVEALCIDTCRLQHLNLCKNGFGTKLGGMIYIGDLLKFNRSITHLSLAHNSLGRRSIDGVIKGLVDQNCILQRLDLSYNKLGDAGGKRLAAALRSNQSVDFLDLTFNKIGSIGAAFLAESLAVNKTVKSLNLSLNVLGTDGAAAFGWLIRYNHTIADLNLSRNNLGDEGVTAIAEGFKSSEVSKLRRLDLSWNSVTNSGAMQCAEALRGNAVIESLNLSSNAIGDVGMTALVHSLYSDLALNELDIVGNQMRDAAALVEYICHPSYKLDRLSYEKNKLSTKQEFDIAMAFQFRENKRKWLDKLVTSIKRKKMMSIRLQKPRDFGDEELTYLVHSLSRHRPVVTTLILSCCRVSDRGVKNLACNVLSNDEAAEIQRMYFYGLANVTTQGIVAISKSLMRPQCRLVCLTLSGCNIDANGAEHLARALEHNTSLSRFDLESNCVSDVGAKAIFAAVLDPPHPTLVALSLARNQLTDDAIVPMGNLCSLEDLQLEGNDISDRGALILAKAAMGSKSLRWLNMADNCLTVKGIQVLHLFLRIPSILESHDQRRLENCAENGADLPVPLP